MSFTSRGRTAFACCTLACVFTGFSARLVDIQANQHGRYAALAADNHGLRQTISARRGSILDVSNLPLAQNEPVKTVIADASLIKDIPAVAQLLAEELELPESEVRQKLERKTFSK